MFGGLNHRRITPYVAALNWPCGHVRWAVDAGPNGPPDSKIRQIQEVVPIGNSSPDILVMEAAQDRQGQRLADGLDGAQDRRVFPQ